MRKSNWVFYIVAAIVSLFLLGLWFYHGFNHVDSPLDPVLTMIWFAIMIVAGITIHRIEKKRREKLRRVYLFDGGLFNAEVGTVLFNGAEKTKTVRNVIESLEYPVSADEEAPSRRYNLRISTEKISDDKWTGKVNEPGENGREFEFSSQDELRDILAKLDA